jgi:anti-sigma28 factor (negative regulator of flagellin synthesis)|tara:strand:+ start:451 stop:666 length:216 start_codon:yes stop_codon:yes gene_type:complete
MSDSVTKWHELNEEGWWTKNPQVRVKIDEKIALEIADEKLKEIKWLIEEYHYHMDAADLVHEINKVINKIK